MRVERVATRSAGVPSKRIRPPSGPAGSRQVRARDPSVGGHQTCPETVQQQRPGDDRFATKSDGSPADRTSAGRRFIRARMRPLRSQTLTVEVAVILRCQPMLGTTFPPDPAGRQLIGRVSAALPRSQHQVLPLRRGVSRCALVPFGQVGEVAVERGMACSADVTPARVQLQA